MSGIPMIAGRTIISFKDEVEEKPRKNSMIYDGDGVARGFVDGEGLFRLNPDAKKEIAARYAVYHRREAQEHPAYRYIIFQRYHPAPTMEVPNPDYVDP